MPADTPVAVGTRVRIDLHGRRVAGWVVELDVEPPPGVDPRPVRAVTGLGPPAPLVALAEWAAWRWAGPVSAFLRTASADRVVRTLPTAPRPERWQLTGPPSPPPGAPRLAELAPGRPTLLRRPPDEDLLGLVAALVADARAAGPGTVLVLSPSRARAERLVARLGAMGAPVAGPEDWAQAAAGWPVVVGARAAAWAPAPRLAAAVVLDAHDEAYTEERAPTADAAVVVAERAARDGAPCLWVSPCPTLVQLAAAELRPPDRPSERAGWPVVSVVDRRRADPRSGLLSAELAAAVSGALGDPDPPGPYVCVLNRTGRARLLACARCGELARCEHCGGPLEQATDPAEEAAGTERPGPVVGALACRQCGRRRPVVCSACGGGRMKVLRAGVSRVRAELEALVQRPVGEVAGPAAPVGPEPVLIGTEAVLHRVPRAAGVAFLDIDQHLLAPRFAAPEEALALLARAGRLVGGRRRGRGAVLVQTRLPDHPVLQAALHGDPGRLVEAERPLRVELGLPPAAALATMTGEAADEVAESLAGPGLEVGRLGAERWLVRAPDHQVLCSALAAAGRPRGRLRVDVDPRDV